MNAMPIRAAMVAILAAASAIGQTTVRAALQLAPERKPAAGFALRDAAGKTAKLKKYRGKVVLLDFWATWCTGCKHEIPWFVEFQQKFGTKHFAVVGVSLDEGGWAVLRPFLAKTHVPYSGCSPLGPSRILPATCCSLTGFAVCRQLLARDHRSIGVRQRFRHVDLQRLE